MEALACNICKEPAWNFMCMDCVARDIKEFLPHKLVKGFQGFHKSFYSHFDSGQLVLNGGVYCMSCRSTRESPVCPHCYTSEVFHWLQERDHKAAQKFARIFSFGGRGDALEGDGPFSGEEQGICDECGEYAEELTLADGEWICRECAEYEEK